MNSSSLVLELILLVATLYSLCRIRNGFRDSRGAALLRYALDDAAGSYRLHWKLVVWPGDQTHLGGDSSSATPPPRPASDLRQIIYFL